MSSFALTFRVDVPLAPGESGWAVSSPASEACRKSLYPSLGLKRHSAAWATITVGTPKADRAIRALADERAAGRAVVGAATLAEVPDRADAAAAPWFLLHTRQVDDFNLWDAYPSTPSAPSRRRNPAWRSSTARIAPCARCTPRPSWRRSGMRNGKLVASKT